MDGQINRSTDSGSSMRFAYPISPGAALTDVLVMPVFLSCDLDSVGPAANAGASGVGVQLPSNDAVQSVFGQRVRPRAAEGCAHATAGRRIRPIPLQTSRAALVAQRASERPFGRAGCPYRADLADRRDDPSTQCACSGRAHSPLPS